jgi:uncharacterized protein YkwD
MHRAPRRLLAFLLGTGVAALHPAGRPMVSTAAARQNSPKATLKTASATAPDIPFDYEPQAEQQLLALANQARQRAGAPPLELDAGLSQAARIHAHAMCEAGQLSHQLQGEPTLPQRLAATTNLQLDQAGENVAFDYDAEHGHQHLMLSPPHRANLLNPAFNVVGLGAVRSGDRLYLVQDFGHALPRYSVEEVKARIGWSVKQMRQRAGLPELTRRDLVAADPAACSMAQADKLGTTPVRELAGQATVLTYTSLRPETLPSGASNAITSRNLHSFSLGACYRRTDTYPTGVYWIVLSFE